MIILPNFITRKRHANAFTGTLDCPKCKGHYEDYDGKKQKWKYIAHIHATRIRYQCKHCKTFVQYDFSPEKN